MSFIDNLKNEDQRISLRTYVDEGKFTGAEVQLRIVQRRKDFMEKDGVSLLEQTTKSEIIYQAKQELEDLLNYYLFEDTHNYLSIGEVNAQ